MKATKRRWRTSLAVLLTMACLIGQLGIMPGALVQASEESLAGETMLIPASHNVTAQCVQSVVEGDDSSAQIYVGTTPSNRMSFVSFTVVNGGLEIDDARLKLTVTSTQSGKLAQSIGVYKTSITDLSGYVNTDDFFCTTTGAPLDSFPGDVFAGDVLDLDVSGFIDGPGTYVLALRLLDGTPNSGKTGFGGAANSMEASRPLLTITNGTEVYVPDEEPGDGEPGDGEPSELPEGCEWLIPSNGQRVFDGLDMGVQPGDTVCLEAGERPSTLNLKNFDGAEGSPITFINHGGVFTIDTDVRAEKAAILIEDSSHFIMTGTGIEGVEYGIRLKALAVESGTPYMNGLMIGLRSTDYTIEHVEVFGAGFAGFMMKTDPLAAHVNTQRLTEANPDGFVQRNTIVRNNYVHHTHGEGMYIGHTWHNRLYQNMWAHELHGLRVYDNIIHDTGWDGLQVAAATQDVKVYGNSIKDYALENAGGHGNGLQIGPGMVGDFYNNLIIDGHGGGAGINNQGIGDMRIFNNLVVNPTTTGLISIPKFNGDDPQYTSKRPIHMMHNTFIYPGFREDFSGQSLDGGQAIWFWNNEDANVGNTAYNNLIVHTPLEGGGERAVTDYIETYDSATADPYTGGVVDLYVAGNYLTTDIAAVRFFDPANNDYRLLPDSPVIDAGADLSALPWSNLISTDMLGATRPLGGGYDAGAYESDGEEPELPEVSFTEKFIDVNGEPRSYLVYVPHDYDASRTYPFVVFHHGDGEVLNSGRSNVGTQKDVGIGTAIENSPLLRQSIIYLPQRANGEAQLWVENAQLVADEYNTDPTRWYMTGLSAGGYVTWNWGGKKHEQYAALMPIAGGLSDTSEEQIEKLAQIPIRAYHGNADDIVPLSSSQTPATLVTDAGGDVGLTVYPGVGHNSWDMTYSNEDHMAWLLDQQKEGAYSLEAEASDTSPIANMPVQVTLSFAKPGGYPVSDLYFQGAKQVTVSGYVNGGEVGGSFGGATLTGASTVVTVTFENGSATVPLQLSNGGEQSLVFEIDGALEAASEPLTMTPQEGEAVEAAIYAKNPSHLVGGSDEVNFYVALNGAEGKDTFDGDFTFDETVLEFVRAELAYGDEGLIQSEENNGSVRVIAALLPPVEDAADVELIKLTFRVAEGLASGTDMIVQLDSIWGAANGEDAVAFVIAEGSASILLLDLLSASDLNDSDTVDIADLSIALSYYRAEAGDANWAEASRADLNFDNIVDLTDFSIFMDIILQAD